MHHAHLLKRSLIAAVLCGVSMAAAADRYDPFKVQGLHGDVSFSGAIIASPCRIAMDSIEQTVDLGVLPNSLFRNVGDRSQPVPFKIRLEDCMRHQDLFDDNALNAVTSTAGYLVKVAIYGESVSERAPNLLGGYGLQGVGLRLMDSKETPLNIGRESSPMPMRLDNDAIALRVALESYGSQNMIKPGRFHANATFRLSYL